MIAVSFSFRSARFPVSKIAFAEYIRWPGAIQSSNLNRNRRDNKRVESRVDTVNPGNTFFSWPAGYLRFGTPRLDDQFSTVRQVDRSFTDTKKQSARSINYRACTSDGLEIDLPRPIRLASIAPLFIPGQICWEIFIRHFLRREKEKETRPCPDIRTWICPLMLTSYPHHFLIYRPLETSFAIICDPHLRWFNCYWIYRNERKKIIFLHFLI